MSQFPPAADANISSIGSMRRLNDSWKAMSEDERIVRLFEIWEQEKPSRSNARLTLMILALDDETRYPY